MNTHMEVEHRQPDDQEMELIAQYLSHEMTPAEEQRFERNLGDDGEFFDRAMPILNAWCVAGELVTEPVIEPIPLHVRKFARSWTARAGGLLAAAAIVVMMVMQRVGSVSAPPPIFPARGNEPHAMPSVVIGQAPGKHAKAPVTAEVATARIDTVAERVLAELARAPQPAVQVTPSRVATIAQGGVKAAPPVSVWVATLPNGKEWGVDTDPLKPANPIKGESWWRRLLNRLPKIHRKPASPAGTGGL